MNAEKNPPIWDKVWEKPDGWYPNEFVVRFLAKYVRKRTGLDSYEVCREGVDNVLDLGCGCGRHLVMLARECYRTHGIDISRKSISFAKQWLEREGLEADLRVGSTTDLPWEKESFDLVISHGVLDHMDWRDARRTAEEVARVLKPGGLFYLSLASTRESGYGRGEEVARHTFRVTEGAETGTVQRFFDFDDISRILNGCFEILDIVHDEWRAVQGKGFSALDKESHPAFARFHVASRKK